MKKKLLYLHNSPIIPGKANINQVIQMCNAFANNHFEVTLVVPHSGIDELETQKILSKDFNVTRNIEIIFIKKFSRSVDWIDKYTYHLRIDKIIDTVRPDLCYVRNTFFLKTCLKHKIFTIFEAHNNLMHEKKKILNWYISKKLLRLSKNKHNILFITISQALAKFWIQSGVPEAKVISLHDGFNSEVFGKENVNRSEEIRKRYGIQNKKIIVYAGSLNPERGMEDILFLAHNLQNCNFLIMGGPLNYQLFYEKIASENGLNNIKFTGFIKHAEVGDYLMIADVLLALWTNRVKTINYCSPLKLFEYMATGKNMVVSGYPTIKEVVDDGVTAFVAEPDNKKELLKKTIEALNYGYPSKIAYRAKQLANSEYSWEIRVKKIISELICKSNT